MNALGLIEVNGYLAAVEAADAALKAANVKLMGLEVVKAGITTVQITGDVGAVKASVDAGRVAAENLGLLRAAHVIPRLHDEVMKILPDTYKDQSSNKDTKEENIKDNKNTKTKEKIEKIEELSEEAVKEATNNIEDKVLKDEVKEEIEEIANEEKIEEISLIPVEDEASIYNSMRVDELKSLVKKLNIQGITHKQIKFARKDELIEILLKYKKEGE